MEAEQNTGTPVMETVVDQIQQSETVVEPNIETQPEPEIEITPETEVDDKETEAPEPEKTFDPENLDFDEIEDEKTEKEEDKENEKNTIEGYDLSKFENDLDLEGESSKEYINSELKQLKELGFSQEQAEKYIQKQIDVYRETQKVIDNENSPEYIQNKLKAELTVDEKRNYKPVTNWVKEQLKDSVDPEWIPSMMANPKLVKVLNSLYKKATNNNSIQPIPKAEKKSLMTIEDAIASFKKQMNEKDSIPVTETKKILTDLKKNLTGEDLEQFNKIYSAILR